MSSPDSDMSRLEERLRKLAAEKAALELMNRLMARLTQLPGLDQMIETMLQSILDTIGGTNIKLYFWIDGRLHYADVFGERRALDTMDDPDVSCVRDSLTPLEKFEELSASRLIDSALGNAWTWIMPLLVGKELVGILKVEHCNLPSQEIRIHLPNFLSYAAAVLKNDIFGHTQLMQAYAEVKQANESLAEARDAAESANRSKSVFLANMSHELRTPLNAVLGFAQLMSRDSNLSREQKQNLATIEHSGQHLLELINDILELSRVEAGKLTLRVAPFELPSLLTTLVDMIQVRAQAKGLMLRLNCRGNLPDHAEGDAFHLRQVLINLLTNGVKYTPAGSVTLTVDWNADLAYFEVADTGRGMTREELAALFQPFYQTSLGIAQNEGSGLGLSISRDYVKLMGGEIQVESVPGSGSRFYFTIPLKAVEAPAKSDETGGVIGLEQDQPSRRILIVDDDNESRRLLATLLQRIGLECDEAADGQAGLDRFRLRQPDFVWMDSHMPVLGGTEAIRHIRGLKHGGDVPIIAMTATAYGDDLDRMLQAGANGYVRKPFLIDEVFDTLKKHLALRYRYAEAKKAEPGADRTMDLSGLVNVDSEHLAKLHVALETLDIDAARESVQAIALTHRDLASTLSAYIDGYRLEDLLQKLNNLPLSFSSRR
jgi:signal transduction histidine kinase/CheY-like chemotaxis protein